MGDEKEMSQRSVSDHFLDPLWAEIHLLRKSLDKERNRRKELATRLDAVMTILDGMGRDGKTFHREPIEEDEPDA